jgi:hypothetical protein
MRLALSQPSDGATIREPTDRGTDSGVRRRTGGAGTHRRYGYGSIRQYRVPYKSGCRAEHAVLA